MVVQHIMHCYHCGLESLNNTFKYCNNGKQNQPRYQCSNYQKFFTLGSQGYPEGRSYAKKWNVDPPELIDLPRECRCCGVPDKAPFKYYNNKNLLQPHFKCLSRVQQFQMRLMGTGEERRLVHTRPPNNHKLGLASNSDNKICTQTSTVPWMPVLEEGKDFLALSVEDVQYLNLIEAGLKDENESPPPEAVVRLQLWASKLPQRCC